MTVGKPEPTLRRAQTAELDGLARLLAPREPTTTALVADLAAPASRRRRVLVLESGDRVAAAVVLRHPSPGRCLALVAVLDTAAAPEIARFLDVSRARWVQGPAADVALVARYLRRGRRQPVALPLIGSPSRVAAFRDEDADRRTRLATAADLDALVELYRAAGVAWGVSRRRLLTTLRDRVRHGPLVVAEERGRLRAAAYGAERSPQFLVWGGLAVDPAHGGRGLAAALFPLGALVSRQAGLQPCFPYAPTNGMRLKARRIERLGLVSFGEVAQLGLGMPPGRIRGERRARLLLEGFAHRARTRGQPPPPFPEVADQGVELLPPAPTGTLGGGLRELPGEVADRDQ